MTPEQQIAAVRAALAAIETAIAQTEAALRMPSTTSADVLALTSTLVDLRAERARLQLQLADLEAASVVVPPLAAAKPAMTARASTGAAGGQAARQRAAEAKALEKSLKTAVTDRTIVTATLDFATNVASLARSVRMIGDTPADSTLPKPKKPGKP